MTLTIWWLTALVSGVLGAASIAKAADAAKALRPARIPVRPETRRRA